MTQFGYHTEHVLFNAHADGTVSARIALYVAGDYHNSRDDYDAERDNNDSDEGNEVGRSSVDARNNTSNNQDLDPDPPGIGVTVPRPSTNPNTDTAEAGA